MECAVFLLRHESAGLSAKSTHALGAIRADGEPAWKIFFLFFFFFRSTDTP
jgi:hypothetical protein